MNRNLRSRRPEWISDGEATQRRAAARLHEPRPKAGPSLSATAEISYPRGKPTPRSTKSSQEKAARPSQPGREQSPLPGNPGAAVIRATLLDPRVAGQERPQHPLRSSLLPRAGQGEGLRALRPTRYRVDGSRPAPSFSAQGAVVPLASTPNFSLRGR